MDRQFVAEHPARLTGTKTLAEFVRALERPRRILMMIKAGAPVDSMLEQLKPLLEPGDIVIDGGNSLVQGHAAPRGGVARKQGCTSSAWASPAARRARAAARR